jgi:predicted dehydrogenase
MPTSNVRWGLVSTANINKNLIPVIRASRRGELVAVASRNGDKAEAYAQKWDIPHSFEGYQTMLDSGEVDAVYVSLPNHLHAEWSIRAMEAGCHVLCEKPFAITMEQVDEMIRVSEETGCHLAEAFMYRHHPQTKLVGEMVQSGQLGEITLVRGAFDFNLPQAQRQSDHLNVRLVPEWGGGCLWDVGIYPLSFVQYIFGQPPEIVFGNQWLGDTGVDETFAGQMAYSDGRMAQISASFRTPFHTFIEIIGTEGRLYVPKPFTGMTRKDKLLLHPEDGKTKKIRPPQKELYLGEVEDMHAAILDGKPNLIQLEETRNHVRTALALYQSAQTGEPVHL